MTLEVIGADQFDTKVYKKGKIMRSVICENFGPPENLVVKKLDPLKPKKGQVRIAVEACGVNFPDTLIIKNKYQFKPDLPFSPGGEVTGIIDMLGSDMLQQSLIIYQ